LGLISSNKLTNDDSKRHNPNFKILINKNNWIIEDFFSKSLLNPIKSLVLKSANVEDDLNLSKFLLTSDSSSLDIFYNLLHNSVEFSELEKAFLEKIQNYLNHEVKLFCVKGFRVAVNNTFSLAPWHQDEGTWNHHKALSQKNPYTCWIPIQASDSNTLELCLDKVELKEHFRNSLGQPYANFEDAELSNRYIIKPNPGWGYLFSCYQPHRSYIRDVTKVVRISVDFRFNV